MNYNMSTHVRRARTCLKALTDVVSMVRENNQMLLQPSVVANPDLVRLISIQNMEMMFDPMSGVDIDDIPHHATAKKEIVGKVKAGLLPLRYLKHPYCVSFHLYKVKAMIESGEQSFDIPPQNIDDILSALDETEPPEGGSSHLSKSRSLLGPLARIDHYTWSFFPESVVEYFEYLKDIQNK